MPNPAAPPGGDNAPPQQSQPGSAAPVLGVVFALSTLLGIWFFYQYSVFMSYTRATLELPEQPLPWKSGTLSPDACVDEALDWARNCTGIKTLCDLYVPRLVRECMASQPRQDYCASIEDASGRTSFGVEACRARKVRRHIDKEACANAWKALDEWCVADRKIEAKKRAAGSADTGP